MWEVESEVDSDTEAVVDVVAEGVTECPDCDTEMVVGTLSEVEMVKLSVSAIDAVVLVDLDSEGDTLSVEESDTDVESDKDGVEVAVIPEGDTVIVAGTVSVKDVVTLLDVEVEMESDGVSVVD